MGRVLLLLLSHLVVASARAQPATVAITFDYHRQGYVGGLPILKARGLPATFYVASESSLVDLIDNVNYPNLTSTTNELIELQKNGWEIGIYSNIRMERMLGSGEDATSATSLSIGTGTKVFTTQSGLSYYNKTARVRAMSAADNTKWMEGFVTYSGDTLTMTVDRTNGSGTINDWVLSSAIATKAWMQSQKAKLAAKGFNARSYAPAGRRWTEQLANLSRDDFDNVRVINEGGTYQTYPIPDRNSVRMGATNSLSSADTAVSLCSQLSALISAGPVAWFVVVHKVGNVADDPPHTIASAEFEGFADCLKTARDAGQVRVVRFSQAMEAPVNLHPGPSLFRNQPDQDDQPPRRTGAAQDRAPL